MSKPLLPAAGLYRQLFGAMIAPGSLANTRLVRLRHAAIASVLALYPSTTTEIPFT